MPPRSAPRLTREQELENYIQVITGSRPGDPTAQAHASAIRNSCQSGQPITPGSAEAAFRDAEFRARQGW